MPRVFFKTKANFAVVKNTINKKCISQSGNKLRKTRLSRNMTIQFLADTINVEYSQLSRILRGCINISIGLNYEIVSALEIEIKELFDFENYLTTIKINIPIQNKMTYCSINFV